MMVCAATPPTKDYARAQATADAKETRVAQTTHIFRSLEYQNAQIQGPLLKNLADQKRALEELKANVGDIVSGDANRAKLETLLTGYSKLSTAVDVGTLGITAVVKDMVEGAAKDAVIGAAIGDDPVGLKLQGVTNMTVESYTQQGALKGNLAELTRLIALTKDQVVAGAGDEGWIPTLIAWTSGETRALQVHNKKVSDLLDLCLQNASELEVTHARTLEANTAMMDTLGAQQLINLTERDKALEDLKAARADEKPKLKELVAAAILALEPTPPPAPLPPEPPPPVPQETPLEKYIKYYETGIWELNYYLPGWISEALATQAAIGSLFAEMSQVLDFNGLGTPPTNNVFTLGLVEALRPPEPAAASLNPDGSNTPASLSTLAQRHRELLPVANFYNESRVTNAITTAEGILKRITSATVVLRTLQNNITSLEPYAKGMDAYYHTLGLDALDIAEGRSGGPPARISVVAAFQNWPGRWTAVDSGIGLQAVTDVQVDLDYDGGRAPGLIRKLKGSVVVMEDVFNEKLAAMNEDLAELRPVLTAYPSAFLRTEKAVADYVALTQSSVLGRDRPTQEIVNYLNLDQSSRQDLTRTLDLRALNLFDATTDQLRIRLAAARADVLRAEFLAAAYRDARHDLLVTWEPIARLYPRFNFFGGASRFEWTQAWDRQQQVGADYYFLKVPRPDFADFDVGPGSWVFNYQSGNPMLTAFTILADLPVPTLESIDDVLTALNATELMMVQTADAWKSLSAAQVAANLQQWLQTQSSWLRKRPADWIEVFGPWATMRIAEARNAVMFYHGFTAGDPAAPVITRQPVSLKVARGQTAELSIGATGTLYGCDWYIYLPYAGSSYLLQNCPANFDLTFRTPPVTADTLFVCRLRWGKSPDAAGNLLLSDVVSVTVDDSVNQGFSPTSLTVPGAGGTSNVQFTSTGTGGALAWTSASSSSWVSAPAAGAGNASLAIVADPNPLDITRYGRVTIGGTVLNVTQKSSVTPPTGTPDFTQQPMNQTAAVLGSASFSAVATGTVPLTYQWKKGATNLANGSRITGATSATLSLANVQLADAGSYSVVATNNVGSTASDNATLTVTAATTPQANNVFAAAAILTGATASATGHNAGATKETGEPKHAGATGGGSVWWQWTAPGAGKVSVDTIGSNFDTVLAVYTGSSVNGLTAVASDDQSGGGGSSALTFSATVGTVYRFAVDGASNGTGTVQLHLTQAVPPANDNLADAQSMAGNTGSLTGTNVNASGETGEPSHINSSGTASSVWYRWTATASGSVTVDTIGSSFDTVMAVYAGSSLTSLTKLAADDEGGGSDGASRVAFNVVTGGTYFIAVGSYGATRGRLALHWQYGTAPAGTVVPAITTQPQSQSVLLGGNATFFVTASGTAPLNFQWRKGGANLADGATVGGATGATLSLTNVQAIDGGDYSVVVRNLAGNATSSTAALTVHPGGGEPPTISITAPADGANLTMGTSTSLAAVATDPDGTIASVRFFASGVDLGVDATSPYGTNWTPPGPGTYSLTAVATDNSGNQTTSTAIRVSVVVVPTITSASAAMATVGTAFTYTITAGNSPTTFTAMGTLPDGVTFSSTTGVISGTPTAIGTFPVTLIATNANGPSPVVTLTITVNSAGVAPTVTTHPLKQQVDEGGTVTLTVVAGGTAPLSYVWRRGSVPLVNGSRISGAATATLTIAGALPGDSGTYSVVVSNSVNSVTSTEVVVGVVPTGTVFTYAAPGGYNAGGAVTISNVFTYTGTPSDLTLQVLLPEGWSYVSGAGAAGPIEPAPGATSVLNWVWTSLPANPMIFTYTLNVPVNTTGVHDLMGFAVLTQGGVGLQLSLQPDPLPVGPSVLHSADVDCSFRFSLVPCTTHSFGYNRLSLIRASAVVKRQSMVVARLLRLRSQAATSVRM